MYEKSCTRSYSYYRPSRVDCIERNRVEHRHSRLQPGPTEEDRNHSSANKETVDLFFCGWHGLSEASLRGGLVMGTHRHTKDMTQTNFLV